MFTTRNIVLAAAAALLFLASPARSGQGFVELGAPGGAALPVFVEDGPVTTVVVDLASPAGIGASTPTLFVHTRNLTGRPEYDRLSALVRQELVTVLTGPCHVIQPEDMMDLADAGGAARLDALAGNELENQRTEQMAATVANLALNAGAEYGLVVELSSFTANARPVAFREVRQNQFTVALRCTARVIDPANGGRTLLQRGFSTQKTLLRPAEYQFGLADSQEVEPQLALSAAQGVGQQFLENLGSLAAARLAGRQPAVAAAAPAGDAPALVNFFVLAEPENAMVRIDGVTRPQYGEGLYRVTPGRHRLTVSAPNYRSVQTTVEVVDNTVLTVPLTLSTDGQNYADRAAQLRVFSDQAEAQLYISTAMADAVVSAVPTMAEKDPSSVSQPDGAVDNSITRLFETRPVAPGKTPAGPESEGESGGLMNSVIQEVMGAILE